MWRLRKNKMKKLLLIIVFAFISLYTKAQTDRCGTMQIQEELLKKNPALKAKMVESETKAKEWLKDNSRLKYANPKVEKEKSNTRSMMSLCGYDNAYFTSISAPTILNQVVTPSPNCTYGGEYVTALGLVAGNIYRVSTCGTNVFDTQISIYLQGGGLAVAHNDDWCGSQSEIYFNPITSGNYDILIDEYNCADNTLCASLEVELVYTPRPVVTIPVVVHVIYNGEPIGVGKNLSTADIQSQINVLNEDFRRYNTDIFNTPAAFRGSSDDALVEFCLAQQDEFGNPTNGIDRINIGQDSVTFSDMQTIVKPNTIWDATKYLNLWTNQMNYPASGLLGIAQFPWQLSSMPSTDGVIINYKAFGTISAASPYDLGRTATHEVGHWLGLKHIWGDEPACAVDDSIADTPLQGNKNFGVPTFPLYDACAVNYPGEMFYNYMDYCDDITLTMFTTGQTSRIDGFLFTDRVAILSSLGCMPSTVSVHTNSISNYISLYPNPSNGNFTLNLKLNKEQNVSVTVLNILGEKVFELNQQKTGNENISLDISNQPNGIYFVHINTLSQSVIKKMVINKSN